MTAGPSTVPVRTRTPRTRTRAAQRRAIRAGAGIIVLVVAWQLLSSSGTVDPFLVPAPLDVAGQLVTLGGPDGFPAYVLWEHIGWSVLRLLAGVLIGCVVGVPVGMAMGVNRYVNLALRPILTVLLSVPSLALTPILILMLGLNNKVAIVVIAIEAAVVMAYNAQVGAAGVPQHMKWALASFGAGRLTIFARVVLPASLPQLLTAMKLSVGYGWRALIAVESIAATSHGLGYMIFQAQSYMDTRTIFAGIVAIAVVGLVLERLVFGRLETKVNSWYAIKVKD